MYYPHNCPPNNTNYFDESYNFNSSAQYSYADHYSTESYHHGPHTHYYNNSNAPNYENFTKKGYNELNYGTYSYEHDYQISIAENERNSYYMTNRYEMPSYERPLHENMGPIQPHSLQISTEIGYSTPYPPDMYNNTSYHAPNIYHTNVEMTTEFSPVTRYKRMPYIDSDQRINKTPYTYSHYTPQMITAHENQKSLFLNDKKSKSQHLLTLNFNKLETSTGDYQSDKNELKFKLWCKRKYIVWQVVSEFIKSRFMHIDLIKAIQTDKETLLYTKLTEPPSNCNSKLLTAHFPKEKFKKLCNILMELVDVIHNEINLKATVEEKSENTISIRVKTDFEDDFVNTPSSGSTANDELF